MCTLCSRGYFDVAKYLHDKMKIFDVNGVYTANICIIVVCCLATNVLETSLVGGAVMDY